MIYKEPGPLYASEAKREIGRRVLGRIIVSHVRLATTGSHSVENTHPWIYRGWVFAHNGVIRNRKHLLDLLEDQYRETLEGETDSEVLFHLVVQEAERKGDPVEGIVSAVRRILEEGVEFSSLNFIASDGRRLYALRYANTMLDYYTLYYIERPKEKLYIDRLSRITRQLIQAKLARGERAVIIASEIMSDEPHWVPLPNRSLLVVDSRLRYNIVKL